MKWNLFVGQERIKRELLAYLKSRKRYGLPNFILSGPYGCGKTTLAQLFADTISDLWAYYPTGDDKRLYKIDFAMAGFDVLIIDEIHMVRKWEHLYPVLASTTCLIGATTKAGAIDLPFLSRCTVLEFSPYTDGELREIASIHLNELGSTLDIPLDPIISRSRGVPRVVINLAIRLMRFMEVNRIEPTEENAEEVLTDVFQIGPSGMTAQDRIYLESLSNAGRPVGLRSLAHMTSLSEDYILELVEPYLIKQGLVIITAKGRVLV